ncbi:ABC transporter ATP-binding protein, partial [Burkholderia multivorans]
AVLGRNGVGKAATLPAAPGVADVTAGRITFDGHDFAGRPAHEINRLGLAMVPEGRRLFPNLTVAENLRLAAGKGGASVDEMFALFPR